MALGIPVPLTTNGAHRLHREEHAIKSERNTQGVRARLAVGIAAVLFGSTFVVVQHALTGSRATPFVAVRFAIATTLLWPLARRRKPRSGEWAAGLAAGVPLAGSYILQTLGLNSISSPESAFITNLFIVIVPITTAVTARRMPAPAVAVGAVAAAVGLYLLTGARATVSVGEALTLGCALCLALNIVILARIAPKYDVVRLTAIQMLVVALVALVPGFVFGGYRMSSNALLGAAYTAVAASALAFSLQVWGQQRLSATQTSLLLLLEPITAALISTAQGVPFLPSEAAGAALILTGIAVSELKFAPWGRRSRPHVVGAQSKCGPHGGPNARPNAQGE